jgi:hypothetical protein
MVVESHLAPDVEHFVRLRIEDEQKRAALVADIEAGLGSLNQGKGVHISAKEILAARRKGTGARDLPALFGAG